MPQPLCASTPATACRQVESGASLLAHALEFDPELDDAEYVLAECRAKNGDARGQRTHLGHAFELRGDMERAHSAYEKALDLAPKDSPEHARGGAARHRADRERHGALTPSRPRRRTTKSTISNTIRRMTVSSRSSARAVAVRLASTSAIFWTSSSLPSTFA